MTSLDYQGIGPRLIAQIIDAVILFILYFIVGAVMFGGFAFDVYGAAAVSFLGVYGLLGFLYFPVLEGLRGATVGKMVMKITVVREDGSACGFGPALIRNILRIIDVLPFLYIIGLILISRSDKKQRLGDRIAKTAVIKSSRAQSPAMPAPQANRFCMNCGAELSGQSPFCPKCGAKQ
jgi:uncharacterized RDD family membrane protein YckC